MTVPLSFGAPRNGPFASGRYFRIGSELEVTASPRHVRVPRWKRTSLPPEMMSAWGQTQTWRHVGVNVCFTQALDDAGRDRVVDPEVAGPGERAADLQQRPAEKVLELGGVEGDPDGAIGGRGQVAPALGVSSAAWPTTWMIWSWWRRRGRDPHRRSPTARPASAKAASAAWRSAQLPDSSAVGSLARSSTRPTVMLPDAGRIVGTTLPY